MWKILLSVCFISAILGVNSLEYDLYNSEVYNDATGYMCGIFENTKPICAGVLVRNTTKYNYLVTAASCVFKISSSALWVQIGTLKFNKTEAEIVETIFVHPYYLPPSIDYNIAVIKFKVKQSIIQQFYDREINLDSDVGSYEAPYPQPLYLNVSSEQPTALDKVQFILWNLTKNEEKLEQKDVSIENKLICKKKLAGFATVTSKMICVNYNTADSMLRGSPIIFNGSLAGITSYTVPKNPTLPKIFVNIANSEILSFINRIIDVIV